MIIALIIKDLNQVARDRTFSSVLAGFLFAYLAASLFFFSNSLTSLFWRISLLQGVLFTALIPWIVLRMHEQDLGGDAKPFGTATMATPFQVMLSKVIASAVSILKLAVLALPALCLAELMGAATYREIAWVLINTFLFMMLMAVIVFHLRLRFRSWLPCWVLSYAVFVLAGLVWYRTWNSNGPESCSLLLSLLLAGFTVLLFPHANRMLLYERN